MTDMMELYRESRRLSILLVEDHQPLREQIGQILGELFAHVDQAGDGFEAMNACRLYKERYGRNYDLIMTDIQMPHMNGIALVEQIRRQDERQSIVVLSAHQDREYLLSLINLGISHFVTKPIQNESFFEVLYKVSRKINQANVTQPPSHLVKLSSDCVWNTQANTLTCSHRAVSLTRHELLLMSLLSAHFEQVCSMERIIEHFAAHGIEFSPEGVRNLMARLRKKIPPGIISSIYGLGYKLGGGY